MPDTAKTILVVEDELPLQHAVVFKLEQSGFSVSAVATAEGALNELKTHRPDLIWLDLLLPGMNGLQFLEVLRSTPGYKDIPIMIVSVLNDQRRIKKAFELNVVDYTIKSQASLESAITKVKTFFTPPSAA